MESLPSLRHDSDHYTMCYKLFSAKSSMLSVFSRWAESVFSEAVVAKLQATLNGQEELRVLGVGSGGGETDCFVLEKLLKRFPNINNRVVEPTQQMLSQYKAFAQSKAHKLQGVSCDWRQQTIEQYEKAGDLAKFHFISTVHSIYYVDDVEHSLMYLYNRLEPGGILLVIIVTDSGGLLRFADHFLSFRDQMHYVSSADIRNFLDDRGIPYTQYHQPSRLDITKCFDEASEEGRLLVDFITQVVNFKETAPEDLQRSVMEYLGSSDCSEKTGDEVWFNDDWHALVISKPLGGDNE